MLPDVPNHIVYAGAVLGVTVGFRLGAALGLSVGVTAGLTVGDTEGVTVGATEGVTLGTALGSALGLSAVLALVALGRWEGWFPLGGTECGAESELFLAPGSDSVVGPLSAPVLRSSASGCPGVALRKCG